MVGMKILFVNFRNNNSSAVLRVSESLRKVGVDVFIFSYISLVKKDIIFSAKRLGRVLFSILFYYDIFVTRYIYRRTGRLFSRNSNVFSNSLVLIYAKFFRKFDLIHLHWVGHGFISSKFLRKIKCDKIVLTLHDYYFITGGCHVPGDCLKFTKSCTDCPANYSIMDLPNNNFKSKIDLYSNKKIYVTAPSNTMKTQISNSYLGSLFQEVLVVPNPIDVDVYKPTKLNYKEIDLFKDLPENKKFILFVSNDIVDFNKGFDLLLETLKLVDDLDSVCLLTVGNNYDLISDKLQFSHHHFGEINKTKEMIKIYNISYLTVVPSRFESFSQVTLESMSCGVPVIAFNSSGPSEIITNNADGFLIKSFSVEDYLEKINTLLGDEILRDSFSKRSRERVVSKYSYKAIGGIMKDYYKKIIDA